MISARTIAAKALGISLALCWLAGCATPGPPQPPSLQIPKPVEDLKAVKTGDHVVLSWTAPKETTDDENLHHLGKTTICRDFSVTGPNPSAQCTAVTQVPSQPGSQQTYTDTLPADLTQKTGLLIYRVQVFNPEGKSDDPSKPVIAPAAFTLPALTDVRLGASRIGVKVEWTGEAVPPVDGVNFFYAIMRRDAGTAEWKEAGRVPAASGPLSYLDTAPEFGHDYDYEVTPLSQFTLAGQQYEVQGNPSASQAVAFRDVFPPASPAGLQAVYAGIPGQDAIDLSWNPEQERDLAGYNVYRREQDATPARINSEIVTAPAYHDSNVVAGRRYFYSVTAVDSHGVESKPSAEASEVVPAPTSQ